MSKTINGRVTINSETIDFELDNSELILFYNNNQIGSVTTAKEISNGRYEFLGTEQVSQNVFEGTTSSGQKIAFKVAISIVDYIHFRIICSLECYYILNSKVVNSITIIGKDIHRVVKDYSSHKTSVDKNGITIPFEGNKHFHNINLEDNKSIDFACYETFKTFQNSDKPVEFIGQIQMLIQPTDSIEELFQIVELARSFIIYLCFRRDVIFDEVFIGNYSDNKFTTTGQYFPLNNPERLSSQTLMDSRMIPISFVEEIIPELIKSLYKNTIYIEHMRTGMTKKHIITGGDIVTLTAGFEYEFDKSGLEVAKKEGEINQRRLIKDKYSELLLDERLNAYGRSTIKNAIKHVDDLMLEAKLNAFFGILPNDFLENLKSIFKKVNIIFSVSHLCHNISEARNKIAHGDIDYHITKETVYDFLILEMVVYFVQLKRFGLDDSMSYKSIASLFDIAI